jgi:sterol desaturase/sphingolipid hydroxylase (fatty acid hydroxylase superfamily)
MVGWNYSVINNSINILNQNNTNSQSLATDIFMIFLEGIGISHLLGIIGFLGITIPINYWLQSHFSFDGLKSVSNPVLRFLITFVILDFFSYWIHRAQHSFLPFWKLHEFHHSAISMTGVNGFRFHPVELILKNSPAEREILPEELRGIVSQKIGSFLFFI